MVIVYVNKRYFILLNFIYVREKPRLDYGDAKESAWYHRSGVAGNVRSTTDAVRSRPGQFVQSSSVATTPATDSGDYDGERITAEKERPPVESKRVLRDDPLTDDG